MTTVAESKKSYDNFKAKWKKLEEKAKEEGEESEHLSDMAANPGVYGRGGAYAKNGYHYIKNKADRKKVYDSTNAKLKKALESRFKRAQGTTVGSSEHISRYKYVYSKTTSAGKQFNFHNQNMPYQSEAHHMLPNEVFSGKKAEFNESQLELLRKVPYNLNHGENIIFLPKYESDCVIHSLPQHNGSHPKYNKKAGSEVKKVKSKLGKKKAEPCKPTEVVVEEILTDLISYQQSMWDWIIKQGPGKLNDHSDDGGI
ncbi:AHH domain-containing protein [Hahella ganghwensis]|uniref:AHH domain-containing protein n=1 Tax=Hahella ganghwensis TaxID=286420 RepID=UPI00036FD9E6|nr:AHH domain-containing protein [Hahella ganghwensis]